MKYLTLAIVLTALIPILVSLLPFVIYNQHKILGVSMRFLSFTFILFLLALSYFRTRYAFEYRKSRLRRLNDNKILYKKTLVNRGF